MHLKYSVAIKLALTSRFVARKVATNGAIPEVSRTAVQAFVPNQMLPWLAASDFFVWELKRCFLLKLKSSGPHGVVLNRVSLRVNST